jgi:hypothetical protein
MDPSELVGAWFHSHEEDRGDLKVYRDSSYEFPRSRAPRESLRIVEDGSVTFGRPGPTDAAIASPGRWELDGDVLKLSGLREEAWTIETLEHGRLVLRPLTDEEGR